MPDTQPDISKSTRLPRQQKGGIPLMLGRRVANLVLQTCESMLNLQVRVPFTDGTGILNARDADIKRTELGTIITLPPMALPGSGGSASIGGVNYRTANYTALAGDNGFLIAFNSASALTLTLPATPPSSSWFIFVQCMGSGGLTVNRNGLNIDTAAANLTLTQNQGVVIFTDGTNYFTERGIGSSSGGASTQMFQIVSDGGDYWVCNKVGGSALAIYNITKPWDNRAGTHAVGSQVLNGVTYTYTYTAIKDSATNTITISYKRKAAGSDGSTAYDYMVPPPFGNDNTPSTGSNPIIIAQSGAPDVTSPDTVIQAVQNAGGAGYMVGDTLTIVGGTGTAATLTVTSVAGGAITNVSVLSPGAYTANPPSTGVGVTGGHGTGATFNLTFGGQWTDLNWAGRAWTFSPYN